MGILNVTPDSFSDGGRWLDPAAAVARGLEMAAQGADVVDVGGESTRPGAEPVPAKIQIERVVPVIEALAGSMRVSVDTRDCLVAEAAVSAGATLINDVSASSELAAVAASGGVGWVAMHMQGEPKTMQQAPAYGDVVSEVRAFLEQRATSGRRAGVDEVWIDPGIGFGKTVDHNLALLRAVGDLAELGYPVLVGTSRKAFLSRISESDGGSSEPENRVDASVATALWSVLRGASMVRVHDVKETVEALRLAGEPVMAEVA